VSKQTKDADDPKQQIISSNRSGSGKIQRNSPEKDPLHEGSVPSIMTKKDREREEARSGL
jgi:hypothetical protein